jgi:thiamine-phosphate pyrophosphorylase
MFHETSTPLPLRRCHRPCIGLRAYPPRASGISHSTKEPAQTQTYRQARFRLLSPAQQGRLLRGLYVIIDPAACGDLDPLDVARQAIEGGARILQLRDKARDKGLQLPLAELLARLCRDAEVPFIVNDHVDLALAVGADGVHVGQKDLPVAIVHRLVGSATLIGASTSNPDEARKAEADGADYVSVGRLYETGSKSDTRPATTDTIRAVRAVVSIPVCAIGGINESNVDEVIAAGADIVAVISAVCGAPEPREAARRLAARFS